MIKTSYFTFLMKNIASYIHLSLDETKCPMKVFLDSIALPTVSDQAARLDTLVKQQEVLEVTADLQNK